MYTRIVVADGAPLPYHTAADALAADLELPVTAHDTPQPAAINLGPIDFTRRSPEGAAAVAELPSDEDWCLLHGSAGGDWLVMGASSWK